jgi:hypothetical protein
VERVKYNPMYDPPLLTRLWRWLKRERYRRLNGLTHTQLREIEKECARPLAHRK